MKFHSKMQLPLNSWCHKIQRLFRQAYSVGSGNFWCWTSYNNISHILTHVRKQETAQVCHWFEPSWVESELVLEWNIWNHRFPSGLILPWVQGIQGVVIVYELFKVIPTISLSAYWKCWNANACNIYRLLNLYCEIFSTSSYDEGRVRPLS